jgi:hypothetical protein
MFAGHTSSFLVFAQASRPKALMALFPQYRCYNIVTGHLIDCEPSLPHRQLKTQEINFIAFWAVAEIRAKGGTATLARFHSSANLWCRTVGRSFRV